MIFTQDASDPKWIRGWVGTRARLGAVPGIEHRFLGGVDRSIVTAPPGPFQLRLCPPNINSCLYYATSLVQKLRATYASVLQKLEPGN